MKQFLLLLLVLTLICFSRTEIFEYEEDDQQLYEQVEELINSYEDQKQFFSYIDDLVNEMSPFSQDSAQFKNDIAQSLEQYTRTIFCSACQKFYTKLQTDSLQKLLYFIDRVGVYLCTKFKIENEDVCTGILPQQIQTIASALQEHYMDPNRVCPELGWCLPYYKKISIHHLIHEILKDKPKNSRPVPALQNTYKILQVTDMHIDMKYVVGENIYCNYVICCRDQVNKYKELSKYAPAGQWGSEALCDLPIQTVRQFASFIKNNLTVDYVMWNGDNQGRDVWQQTLKEVLYITNLTTSIFMEVDNNLNFLPLLGNHDNIPCNIQDIRKINQSDILQLAGQLWEPWIGSEAAQHYRQFGYYKYYNTQLDILFLVLNTQACYSYNIDLIADPSDTDGQLKWLRQELTEAEKNNQKVYIVGHVPPSGCLTKWAKVYNAIVERFEYIIRGQFFGHEHCDSFEIQKNSKGEVYGIPFLGPSLTSENDDGYLLPSFRVYEIDAETKIPINMKTYRLNLTYWNQFPDADQIVWDLAVDYLKDYKMDNMYDYNNFKKLQEEVKKDSEVRDLFWYNYHQGNRPYNITKKNNPKLHCTMESLFLEEAVCKRSVEDYLLQYAVDKVAGSWIEPIHNKDDMAENM